MHDTLDQGLYIVSGWVTQRVVCSYGFLCLIQKSIKKRIEDDRGDVFECRTNDYVVIITNISGIHTLYTLPLLL